MTVVRCLLLLVCCWFAVASAHVDAHGVMTPVVTLHGAHDAVSETDATALAPLHVTPSGSDSSQDRADNQETITFQDHAAVTYEPGEVVAPGGSDASEGGTAAPAPSGSPFDITSSLDEILDFFARANTSAPPASSSQPPPPSPPPQEAAGNTTSRGSSSSGSGSTGKDTAEKTEESVFDHDAAAADKRVVPSPSPTTAKPSPKPDATFQSAAMISTFCNAAFIAIALSVVVLP